MEYLRLVITLFICFCTISLLADDHHPHRRNEIGFSGGAIYTLDHKVWGGGIHIHYFRTLGEYSRWSLGGGLEQSWSDGNHFSVGVGTKYRIIDRLSIGIIPGIVFFKHDEDDVHAGHEHEKSDRDTRFSVHFEVVYDLFHWERFHFGPAIDYSLSKNDSHFMAGLHFAFCF